ncbi:uncharacterized protein PG986_014298 [Apiospora aurea]|uniref:Uncharacterized protein n=1 Tax=Apiospora aurea TaxID=335848 RepID=A0ABR1PSK9_9PEZI
MPTQNRPFNFMEHKELGDQLAHCCNLAYEFEKSAEMVQKTLSDLPSYGCTCDCDCRYLVEEYIAKIQDASEWISELEFRVGNEKPTPVEDKQNDRLTSPMDWVFLGCVFGFILCLMGRIPSADR